MHLVDLVNGRTTMCPTDLYDGRGAQKALDEHFIPDIEENMGTEFASYLEEAIKALEDDGGDSLQDEIDSCYEQMHSYTEQLREIQEYAEQLMEIKAIMNNKKATDLLNKLHKEASNW